MLSISVLGSKAPVHRAAYAPILHAESSWLQRSADWNQQPVSDLNLSHCRYQCVRTELSGYSPLLEWLSSPDRDSTDTCMLDAFSPLTTQATWAWTMFGLLPLRTAGESVTCFTAGDFRWIWKQLHDIHGIEDGAPEDADIPTKRSYREAQSMTRVRLNREEMYRALDECNLAGDIKTTSQAFESPTAKHRDTSVAIDARDEATRRALRPRIVFRE